MERKKSLILFLVCVGIITFSGLMSWGFQIGFGTIRVQEVVITDPSGTKIVGKLFVPAGVDSSNPAPGVLGLHGYNNDKDVQRGTALEIAKTGIVVLSLDQTGHGESDGALSWYLQGADRAYKWLANQSFVDGDWMGIYGHSMGYIVAQQVAGLNPDHDACVFQSFPPLPHNFASTHNVLHIWAEYEEWYTFGGAYDENMTVPQIIEQGLLIAGGNAGIVGPAEVDVTYGFFHTGTAYREHLALGTTHPGLTMDLGCTMEAAAWFLQALTGMPAHEAYSLASAGNQTYLYMEIFGGIVLLFTFISLIFLFLLITKNKFFKDVEQPIPERVVVKKKYTWWIFATVNTALAAIVYMYFTHADQDWAWQDPIFGMDSPFVLGMFNNFLGFYLVTAAIALGLVSLWYALVKIKDRGSINLYDLGVTYSDDMTKKEGGKIWLKTLLVVGILFAWMYLVVSVFQSLFFVQLRVFWSFMSMFTLDRLTMFFWYLPIMIPFFLINGGVFLFGQIRQKEHSTGAKTQIVWWLKACYAMLAGVFVLFLVQYLGPVFGANYIFAGWDFNPIMPLQLMGVIPLSMMIYFLMVFFYRKTGKIYLGSIIGAIITTWFLCVGGVVGAGL